MPIWGVMMKSSWHGTGYLPGSLPETWRRCQLHQLYQWKWGCGVSLFPNSEGNLKKSFHLFRENLGKSLVMIEISTRKEDRQMRKNQMEIRIKDLDKYYGRKHALKHLTLTIPSGMFGLLGRKRSRKERR